MRKIKKIENNVFDSFFANCEIENDKMANILGGTVTINITCNSGETLQNEDYKSKCDNEQTKLNLKCGAGASLCGAIVIPMITISLFENQIKPISVTIY